jgi:hypothetical protein
MTEGAETKDLLARLRAGVKRLTTGEEWQRMLDMSSRLHAFSWVGGSASETEAT